jgi:hypothetical protein
MSISPRTQPGVPAAAGTSHATWWVEILLSEEHGHTRAVAHLHAPGAAVLSGTGMARRNPSDRDEPLIGEELAAARALTELAHHVLERAREGIAAETHERVTLPDLG